jgi:hypothetical protein
MAEKCKKIVLTVKQKLELITKIENGQSATELVKEMGQGYKLYMT